MTTFSAAYPSYEATAILDELRAREYARLDRGGHAYLDYTAGNLYAISQVERHMALLRDHVFGNPHSTNPTSSLMMELIGRARGAVLRFFNASPDEWVVIFTANASQALKLVGESYPFGPGDRFLLTFDNHNSVNGIREFARAKGATATYVPVRLPEMRVDEADLAPEIAHVQPGRHHLFAYPAQSNFSGVQHPLEWIDLARAKGWDVLLDAASFAPTNRLDLTRWRPDFVTLSFYKIFGYPTGVGCLLARKESLAKLRRPWFAGGTITVASVQGDKYYLAEGAAAFEDGTPDFLALPAVEIGIEHIEAIGIDTIHERVRCLTGWLLDNLRELARPTDSRSRASTARRRPTGGEAPSRSTSTAPTAARSIIASSRRARMPPTSRCARVVSATPAAARWRSTCPARSSPRASGSRSTRRTSRSTISDCASTARAAARCECRSDWSATWPTWTASSALRSAFVGVGVKGFRPNDRRLTAKNGDLCC